MLVAFTGGLTEEQESFVKSALDLSFGEGVVEVSSYSLSDIDLVKELRLRVNDPSVVSVYLGNFSDIAPLEKTRGILEKSGKFFEVESTSSLVDYLNSTYSLSLEYVEKLEEVIEIVPSVSVEDTSKFDALLKAKDETIRNLQLQLKELREPEYVPFNGDMFKDFGDISSYKSKIIDLESKLAVAESYNTVPSEELEALKKENSILELSNKEQKTEISNLESLVADLRRQKEHQAKDITDLNRKLISLQDNSTSYKEEDKFTLPNSLKEVVWGTLWNSLSGKFKNITFVFSGSGDSVRESYIHSQKLLSRGGIFYDLSNQVLADYRFSVKNGKDLNVWYDDSLSNIKNYFSKGKSDGILVLANYRGSFNEFGLFNVNLFERLSYLDSLGINVVVYGGDISSYFVRNLMSSALYSASVQVISRSVGTSARSMLFSSKLVGGASQAEYILVGKSDIMIDKLIRVAHSSGFKWRFEDE